MHNAIPVYQKQKRRSLHMQYIRNTTEENKWYTRYEHAICGCHAAVPDALVHENMP